MSKALKKLGFRFVGPTTCYSLMQVCPGHGLTNMLAVWCHCPFFYDTLWSNPVFGSFYA